MIVYCTTNINRPLNLKMLQIVRSTSICSEIVSVLCRVKKLFLKALWDWTIHIILLLFVLVNQIFQSNWLSFDLKKQVLLLFMQVKFVSSIIMNIQQQ